MGEQHAARRRRLSELIAELALAPERDPNEPWQRGLRAGEVVGRFELVRELGRGGFGVVFLARDRELGREVALKAIRPGPIETDPLRADLLRHEAEAIASLHHPNILTLYDFGRCERGPYLVLELLDGETLAERLARGPLDAGEAVRVAIDVARALVHAHDAGVLHRDLKPTNVFLDRHGVAKVLDFGLAHVFGKAGPAGSGTPGYMAPEQIDGRPEGARTDVYALGVILDEMLGATRGGAGGGRHTGALIPMQLLALVARARAPDPALRPDAAELLDALRRVERRVQDGARRARRRRPLRWAAAAAAVVAGHAAIIWQLSSRFVTFPVKSAAEVLTEIGLRGPEDVGLPPPDEVSFVSDGVTLRGWHFRNPARAGCGVVLHHGQSRTRHGMLRYAPLFWRRGCDVVTYDARHHGASGGETFSFGAHERIDLVAAVNFLAHAAGLPRQRVGILGVSMGGGFAIQAAAIAPDLAFVIADSPYADLRIAARRLGVREYGPLVVPFVAGVIAVGGWRAGFRPAEISPVEEAPLVRVPTLLVHTRNDPVIPASDSEALFARIATDRKALALLAGASAHGRGIREDARAYGDVVDAFLAEHVPGFGVPGAVSVRAAPP